MHALNFSELHRSLLEIQFELIHINNTSTKEVVDLNLFASSRMCVYSKSLPTGQLAELWTKIWTWNSSPCKPAEALDFIFSTVFKLASQVLRKTRNDMRNVCTRLRRVQTNEKECPCEEARRSNLNAIAGSQNHCFRIAS